MIKYYKELDNPNDYEINLYNRVSDPKIDIIDCDESIKQKCYKLIDLLEQKDPLGNIKYKNEISYENITNLNNNYYIKEKINSLFYNYFIYSNNKIINYSELASEYNIDSIIIQKLFYLFNILCENNKEIIKDLNSDNEKIIDQYIDSCINVLGGIKEINNLYDLKKYIYSLNCLLKYQNKIKENDSTEIKMFLDSIKDIDTIKLSNHQRNIKIKEPNAWYITPSGELYNIGGKGSHKGRNISYLLDNYLIRGKIPNNDNDDIEQIRKRGYITVEQFKNYLNYENSFYSIDYINDNFKLSGLERRCYDKKIINIVIGIISANQAINSFFIKLNKESNNYDECINYIVNNISMDEFLIRVCGFYKVLSNGFDVYEKKTIVTSDPNYKNNLELYTENGWQIDYVKPIVIVDGILQEQPDYHETILDFHYRK